VACGVRGIRLQKGQYVIALVIVDPDSDERVVLASEHGFGKRTRVAEFSLQKRGGQGVIAMQLSERNGALVGAVLADEDDEIMLISNTGTLVRTPVAGISEIGRNTQGVTLIRLGKKEKLVEIERIENLEGDEAADADEAGDPS
ncbi:MAG TPA: DNA gyrase subunit A, partial [Gammaproteobacteria bacterium]|nr:DNA gyrase subunit A [Gammaproteobacteria bacterium]